MLIVPAILSARPPVEKTIIAIAFCVTIEKYDWTVGPGTSMISLPNRYYTEPK